MGRKLKIYALYKGDQYIAAGTADELAQELDVKATTIRYYATKTWRDQSKGNRLEAIEIGKED